MLIVLVHVFVKQEFIEEFRQATIENAKRSLQEPGIARFDVMQDQSDESHFVLNEVYRTVEATAAHKDTAHYQVWRDAVAGMMREPRTSYKFDSIFPGAEEW